MLLRMTTGQHKTEISSQYIRCPKFRARMKTRSFGCLFEVLSMEEVLYVMCVNYYISTLLLLVCNFLHVQRQQLLNIVFDFVLDVVNNTQHQHPSFLDNEDHCFGFAMDVLIPEVQLCVTNNCVCV